MLIFQIPSKDKSFTVIATSAFCKQLVSFAEDIPIRYIAIIIYLLAFSE